MLFFDREGFEFQVINLYEFGINFGHHTEFSALQKMVAMLQNGTPSWSPAELMMMSEFSKSVISKYVPYRFMMIMEKRHFICFLCCGLFAVSTVI